jgi:hypothetical protein
LLAAAPAWAAAGNCTLSFAPGVLDGGSKAYAALPPAEVGGWRMAAQSTITLSGACNGNVSEVRLSFSGLESASPGLVRWQNGQPGAGAVRLRVLQATVGTTTVPMVIEGSGVTSTFGPLDIPGNGTLALDLGNVPNGKGRKSFTLTFSVLAMVVENLGLTGATRFSTAPRVELVAP